MLINAPKPNKNSVIAALRSTPERNITVHEPVAKDDLKQLISDLCANLRACDHLSILVVRHPK